MDHDLPPSSVEGPLEDALSAKPIQRPCGLSSAEGERSSAMTRDDLLKERDLLRLQLAEAEKMATIGQMTAGIGHEIKNLIGFVAASIGPLRLDFDDLRNILETLQGLKDSKSPRKDLKRLLKLSETLETTLLIDEIGTLLDGLDEGTRRAQEIVAGLKYYSRTDAPDFVMADIHQELDATLLLLNHKMQGVILIHKDYGILPEVECLPGKLSQVFMNIMSNAIQAIETHRSAGGELSLRTESVDPDRVRIVIRDNGTGMSPEVQAHVFDPFYTTKPREQGNGLGLSISHSIVQLHKGTLEVQSAPGEGAAFVINLPVRQPRTSEDPKDPAG